MHVCHVVADKKWLMFGKSSGAREKPSRIILVRMNVSSITPVPKLLADVATGSIAADDILRKHRQDTEPNLYYTIEEIHLRAETMTPLLKEILDFRPPPHWGINE
jgi:hypothetical protein